MGEIGLEKAAKPQRVSGSHNGIFGGNLMAAVALDAFSQVYTNPLLSRNLWKEETFSGYGWKLIHEKQTLETLLERNVPDAEGLAYIGMGDLAPLPELSAFIAATNDDDTPHSNANENLPLTLQDQ